MYGTDLAKVIRKEIKDQLGFNSRKVSVRNQAGGLSTAIYITVKDLDIALEPIEKLVEKHEEYERCQASGEILSGGNTFIFVEHDWELKHEQYLQNNK